MAESPLENDEPQPLVIGLVGQPNVGKSTVFNLLTGLNQHVGNWPGKTVERKQGIHEHHGRRFSIIDLPGTYSLTSNSPEERITRDFILHEQPDLIIMVADASALERNLYLLTELLVLPVPVVLGLNMMDVAEEQGIEIDAHVLEAALGLPVVPLVAAKNKGVSTLVEVAESLAIGSQPYKPERPQIAEPHRDVMARVTELIKGQVPPPFHEAWVALKLLEGDNEVTTRVRGWLSQDCWSQVHALLAQHEDAVLDIASGRYQWIERMVRAAVRHPKLQQIGLTDRLDRAAVHPFWGLLILMAMFAMVFWITFSVAAPIQQWLDIVLIENLQVSLSHAMTAAPAWLRDLAVQGVLGGAGLVITFIPILLVFFANLAFLEDTGYLARAAYVMDRFMHTLGLHGKSFLPLFLGFGCNVPAVIGARVIDSPSGRLLTILLVPLIPCSARLLILALLAPAFFGSQALWVAWLLVVINLLLLAVVGIVLSHTVFRGQHTAFIMELPLYHRPSPKTIFHFVWNNTWAFLRKAGTLILLVAIAVWALSYFPGTGVEQSYLARIGHTLAPVGEWMGMDWRLLMALLSSFVAKENAIASLAILYGEGEAGLAATLAAVIPSASALAFLEVTLLFIPCLATLAVIRQETRSWAWTLFEVLLLLLIALAAGIAAYHLGVWLGLEGGHA